MAERPGVWSSVAVVSLAALAWGCHPSGAPEAAPPGGGVRVRASGPAAAALLAHGATAVADYGAFQVLDASPSVLAGLPADAGVELRDDHRRLLLNAGEIDTSTSAMQSARAPAPPAGAKALHLVHFVGPIRPEWHDRLRGTGVRVVAYVPHDAYLVWGDGAALGRLHAHALAAREVQWDGPYLDAYKLEPRVSSVETGAYAVQLVDDQAVNADTLALVRAVETRPTKVARALGYVDLVVHADRAAVDRIAARPDVVSIQPYLAPRLLDERQDQIVSGQLAGGLPTGPGYLAWLASKGFDQAQFDASAFGVDLSDSGIDNGTLLPNHFGLYRLGDVLGTSRVAYNRLEGTPNPGSTTQGCDGHGTVNAHIVSGYSDLSAAPFADAQGYRHGLGVAPFVRVGGTVIFDGCGSCFTYPDYEDLQSRAWADGMRVSSNSWGSSSTSYDSDAQRYDALVRDAAPSGSALPQTGNQEMAIVFAAGNSGPGSYSVGSPGNAKNVLTAGASENVRPFGGPDQCGVSDGSADAAMDLAFFSSHGPTGDGRRKPDLVAPGTHVGGGVFQADGQRASPPAAPNGQAASCFNAAAVCGGTGPAPSGDFFPADQRWYTASSGTSHSTPAIAGAAALLRQRFLNLGRSPPSPAMTKAYLMNAARYMTGAYANDSLYSNAQGMGLLDLGAAFDDTPRVLRDQDPTDLFTATGQTRTFAGYVSDSARPFRVTLAWTDAPGATFAAAWVNDLDLTVSIGGTTYRGNVFSGPTSIAGGSADAANNVESVFLAPGASGAYTVTVTAANVSGDGVPNNGIPLDQDFALVISNTCDTQPAAPAGVTAAATADNQVTVSWTPNGAPGYNVYRSTTPGGPYARLASVAAPPYLDAGVSGGTTYHYVVRAQDCAESDLSAEATVTATGACLLPPSFAGLQSAATTGGVTCGIALAWAAATPACGGTIAYDVHRDTASGFTPSPANRIATAVTATSYADSGTLVGGTRYYYVVRAFEASAGAVVSDGNAVERSAVPSRRTFADDFDGNRPANASAWWLEPLGAAQLNLVTGCHYQSPTTAWRFGAASTACGGTYPSSASSLLVLGGDGTVSPDVNGLAVPGSGSTLTFRTWYSFEMGWDGAYLVYSTTGAGGPFSAVPDSPTAGKPYIFAGGYDWTIISASNTRGWTGSSMGANGALKVVTVNLDALAGQTAWFGWHFSSDGVINYEGFYLDDVVLDAGGACFTTPPGPGDPFRISIAGLPASIAADAPASLTLTVLDVNGNVAAGYGGTAALASSDPSAILPSTVTFSGGVATATIRFRKAGTQTVSATDTAIPAVQGGATTVVSPGPDASLAFATQPSNITAGNGFYPAVQVRFFDAFGNPTASSATVALALASNPGSGKILGSSVAAAVNGVATFSSSVDKAGTGYTLSASSPGLSSATSIPFNVFAGYPSALAFTQQPADAIAGATLAPAVAVAVTDWYGNPTSYWGNVSVSLQAGPAGATLSGTLTSSASTGVATFADLSLTKAGSGYQLAASTYFAQVVSAPFTIGHAAPYRATLTQQPADVQAGAPFAVPVSAMLLDRFGNQAITATDSVSLSLASNPGGGQLLGNTTVPAGGGAASFPDVAIDRAGRGYALYVGASGLYGETSVGFDVVAGPAARLAFLTSPRDGPVGVSLTPAIAVAVVDALGNVAASTQTAITLAPASNPSGAALLGTVTRDTVDGVATFADLSMDGTGNGFTLKATAGPGIDGAVSAPFDVWPGPAASYAWTEGANASVGVETQLDLTARDALGNLATGYGGTAALGSSDPQARLPATARFVAGEARVRVTFATPGQQTITATDVGSPSIAGTATVSVTALPLAAGSSGCGCNGGGGLDGVGLACLALAGAALRRRRRR